MIQLEVDPFCRNGCPNFEPDVSKSHMYNDNELYITVTTIRCENRQRCRNHMDYLRNCSQEES